MGRGGGGGGWRLGLERDALASGGGGAFDGAALWALARAWLGWRRGKAMRSGQLVQGDGVRAGARREGPRQASACMCRGAGGAVKESHTSLETANEIGVLPSHGRSACGTRTCADQDIKRMKIIIVLELTNAYHDQNEVQLQNWRLNGMFRRRT